MKVMIDKKLILYICNIFERDDDIEDEIELFVCCCIDIVFEFFKEN